jgi:hypothetical protein
MEVVKKNQLYLVAFIHKTDVFTTMEDRGDVGVFVTIEWAGKLKRTKTVKRPQINEVKSQSQFLACLFQYSY